jgi:DNA-binding response OmpR family regulator
MTPSIMMVDDDPGVLKLYGLFFELNGYRLLKARDGRSGLVMLDHETPDLFILDVMMPEMSGIEFCQHVRARPETAHVPVLMLSAWGDQKIVDEAFAAGATGYLSKPMEPKELEAKVRELLGQAALSAARQNGRG